MASRVTYSGVACDSLGVPKTKRTSIFRKRILGDADYNELGRGKDGAFVDVNAPAITRSIAKLQETLNSGKNVSSLVGVFGSRSKRHSGKVQLPVIEHVTPHNGESFERWYWRALNLPNKAELAESIDDHVERVSEIEFEPRRQTLAHAAIELMTLLARNGESLPENVEFSPEHVEKYDQYCSFSHQGITSRVWRGSYPARIERSQVVPPPEPSRSHEECVSSAGVGRQFRTRDNVVSRTVEAVANAAEGLSSASREQNEVETDLRHNWRMHRRQRASISLQCMFRRRQALRKVHKMMIEGGDPVEQEEARRWRQLRQSRRVRCMSSFADELVRFHKPDRAALLKPDENQSASGQPDPNCIRVVLAFDGLDEEAFRQDEELGEQLNNAISTALAAIAPKLNNSSFLDLEEDDGTMLLVGLGKGQTAQNAIDYVAERLEPLENRMVEEIRKIEGFDAAECNETFVVEILGLDPHHTDIVLDFQMTNKVAEVDNLTKLVGLMQPSDDFSAIDSEFVSNRDETEFPSSPPGSRPASRPPSPRPLGSFADSENERSNNDDDKPRNAPVDISINVETEADEEPMVECQQEQEIEEYEKETEEIQKETYPEECPSFTEGDAEAESVRTVFAELVKHEGCKARKPLGLNEDSEIETDTETESEKNVVDDQPLEEKYRHFCQEMQVKPNSRVLAQLSTSSQTAAYDLSKSRLGNRGVACLLQSLAGDRTLRSLSLADCGLRRSAASCLSVFIELHPSIQYLDLAENNFSIESGKLFLAGLRRREHRRLRGDQDLNLNDTVRRDKIPAEAELIVNLQGTALAWGRNGPTVGPPAGNLWAGGGELRAKKAPYHFDKVRVEFDESKKFTYWRPTSPRRKLYRQKVQDRPFC